MNQIVGTVNPKKKNKNDIQIHIVSLWDGTKRQKNIAKRKNIAPEITNTNKKFNILESENILQWTYNDWQAASI